MFNFKALALTTILALGGIAVGGAAQACPGGGNWCSGNNAVVTPPTRTYNSFNNNNNNGIDSRCYSSTLGQYEVTEAWVDANCY